MVINQISAVKSNFEKNSKSDAARAGGRSAKNSSHPSLIFPENPKEPATKIQLHFFFSKTKSFLIDFSCVSLVHMLKISNFEFTECSK